MLENKFLLSSNRPPPPPVPGSALNRAGGWYQLDRKRVNHFAAFLTVVALGGACRETAAPASGLVVALPSDPQSLDPRFGTDANAARLADLLHAALTRPDAAARRRAEVATAWDMPDPTTFVFHLRRDFHFADGSPLTAADVRATYEAVLDPTLASPKRAALAMVSGIETPDPATVVMHLRAPAAPFDAAGESLPLNTIPPTRILDHAKSLHEGRTSRLSRCRM